MFSLIFSGSTCFQRWEPLPYTIQIQFEAKQITQIQTIHFSLILSKFPIIFYFFYSVQNSKTTLLDIVMRDRAR